MAIHAIRIAMMAERGIKPIRDFVAAGTLACIMGDRGLRSMAADAVGIPVMRKNNRIPIRDDMALGALP